MSPKDKLQEILGINRAVLALSVSRMTDAAGNSILIIIIPLYVAQIPTEHINLATPVLVGLLIGIFGFTLSFTQPLMGALSDKLNKRKSLILVGLGIIAVSTFLFTFAASFFHLVILRILQAIGAALTIPASMSLMTAVTEQKSRGGSMGVFSSFRMVGFVVGPLLGGYLQTYYGFNLAFHVGAGLIFLSMILVSWWVDEVKIESNEKKERFAIFDKSLYSAGIITAALSVFVIACCFSMVTTLENAFNTRLNITAVGFSFAFSTLIITRLIFQIPLGYFSDNYGRRPFILVGLIIMAASTIVLGEIQTMTQFIIIRLIQGFASAAV
ncbi:MAG TPA: MFS transporter, partial [Balneolaceae bacterium]|nr:MFS transporter [Balneolaceae bacterium]